ncbi:MAG: type II toxin-antitoxin system VapC family toxin [Vulcanimicrobiaceae bacterium]
MPPADELTTAVLDASVAVQWLVPERGSEAAASLIERPITWLAPRLLVTEVASALRRKVVEDGLRVEFAVQAVDILGQAVSNGMLQLAEDETLVAAALMLALTLEHKVPDCLYLALAEREATPLVTADRVLGNLAERRGLPVLRFH